jgi:hypothetical protein
MNQPKPKPKPTQAQLRSLYGTTDFKTFDDPTLPDYEPPKPKAKRKRNPLKQYEDTIQKQVVKWFGLQYPALKGLLCYNLNNSRTMISAVNNKALGLVTGRNDLTLYYRGRALLLELKAPDGKQRDEQKQFEALCNEYGNHYRIAWEFEQACDIIRKFITWCENETTK